MTAEEIVQITEHASNILGRPQTDIDIFLSNTAIAESLSNHTRIRLRLNPGSITYYFYIQHYDKDKIIRIRYINKIAKEPWRGNEYVQLWSFPGNQTTHTKLYETMKDEDFHLIFEVE